MIDHISLSVLEAVSAALNVGVPLAVAALGNVIGPVDVTDAVDAHNELVRMPTSAPSITTTRSFPLTSAATITRTITSTASTTCRAGGNQVVSL